MIHHKALHAATRLLTAMQLAVDRLAERNDDLTGKQWGEIGAKLRPDVSDTIAGLRTNMRLIYSDAWADLCVEIDVRDLENADNLRVAVKGDPLSEFFYYMVESTGCCGFFDEEVTINEVTYMIGCNYGH